MTEKYIRVDELGIGPCNPAVFNDLERAHGWNELLKIVQSTPTYTPAEIMAGMWESVEKEYPPYLVWVLVTNGVEFEMAYRIKGAGGAHDGWVGCKNSDTITHWMPLPQPPKEAKHV